MNAIRYGNLRAEIASNAGVRVHRGRLGPPAATLLAPRPPDTPRRPLLLGRDREVSAAFATIAAGQPAGFHAGCGYGKTTLLRYVTADAAARGLASRCVYLRADGNRVTDLLHDLVTRLYVCDQPIKLTPQECGQLLGPVRAIIAIDDLHADPDQLGYLLEVLSGCGLVIGSAQPVLGRRGRCQQLAGLPDDSALAVLSGGLGRSLTAGERGEAQRLVAAVDGQPLHLRQGAGLARGGRHTLGSLARQAAGDPGVLDRLSISALAQQQRRALAVLALAAGTLLPADVVDAIGQLSGLAQLLQSLHERGLAEQGEDRFGLPACKAEGYRQILLKDLDLAVAARGLSTWLTSADPMTADSQAAAEAALTMMEYAAERGDWASAVRLAQAAERVLFLAGRWEAWQHALGRGLDAARASADKAAEAYFVHQQGTLALCQDRLEDAYQLLQQALALREQTGDADGASATRHNLGLLGVTDQPLPPPRPRVPRRVMRAAGGFLATLALIVSTVVITGILRTGGLFGDGPAGSATTHVSRAAGATSSSRDPASSTSGSGSSSHEAASVSSDPASSPDGTASSAGRSSVPAGTLMPQVISFTSAPPAPAVAGNTYAVTVAGGGSGNRVMLSTAPGQPPTCSIAGATVTFGQPGQCVIDASQAGDAHYQPAPQIQQVITVIGIAQAITITSQPPAHPYPGASYTVTATGGGSPNPVTFSIDASSSDAACTIAGATVTFGQPGQCVIDASQAGDTRYQPAPQIQQVITATGIPQAITITSQPPAHPYPGASYTVTATGGGSPNPVTFSIDASSSDGACTIAQTTVTFGQPGQCVIDASQAGDTRYQPAPQIQQVIAVTGIPQAIRFTAPAQGQVGRSVTLSATGGGSGLPVVFSVDPAGDPGVCAVTSRVKLSFIASGRCVIDADQAGNTQYVRAPEVQQTIAVANPDQGDQEPVPRPAAGPGAVS
jgi:hypothetical protein